MKKRKQKTPKPVVSMPPFCARCGAHPCKCPDRGTLWHADVMDGLGHIPDETVQVCVTSPPYFALRSYLDKDDPLKVKEIGSEPTPEAFIATMVRVFREVRRVLRDDGVLFLDLGDSYGGSWGNSGNRPELDGKDSAQRPKNCAYLPRGGWDERRDPPATSHLQQGQLLNIPHRVAEALRADGWIWRQTIVWGKRSPMPEAIQGWRWQRCRVKVAGTGWKAEERPEVVAGGAMNRAHAFGTHGGQVPREGAAKWQDCPGCPKCKPNGGYVLRKGKGRCTTAHEYVFLFSKTDSYFWDMMNSREEATGGYNVFQRKHFVKQGEAGGAHLLGQPNIDCTGRNPRSVWTLSTEPTKVKHFATFPSELVRRCLIAAVSPKGCCPECFTPLSPVVVHKRVPTRPGIDNKIWKHDDGDKVGQRSDDSPNLDPERHVLVAECKGYRPSCNCHSKKPPAKQIVLDPFCGLATVGQTALFMGHAFIGIDLNQKYLNFAKKRIKRTPVWRLRQLAEQGKKAESEAAEKLMRLPLGE